MIEPSDLGRQWLLFDGASRAAGLIDSRVRNPCGVRVCSPSSQHHGPCDHRLEICWSRRQHQCQFHRRLYLIPARSLPPVLPTDPAHVPLAHGVLRTHGVQAAPHHPPKPPLSSDEPGSRSQSMGWNTPTSPSTSKLKHGRRPSVQLIQTKSAVNDVHQHPRLVANSVVVIQLFCSASSPNTNSSRLRTPGPLAAHPDRKWKGWWRGSRRLHL